MAKLIQIVGTSCSGKNSVHDGVVRFIEERGFEVVRLQEPGPLEEFVRAYRRRSDKNPWTEAALFTADRIMLYDTKVFPRWKDESLVFSSVRGLPDTVVYQGLMGGVDVEVIMKMNAVIPSADLCLVLIVDGDLGHQRALQREQEGGETPSPSESPERINALARHYLRLPEFFPNVHHVDTTHLTKGEVLDACVAKVREVL